MYSWNICQTKVNKASRKVKNVTFSDMYQEFINPFDSLLKIKKHPKEEHNTVWKYFEWGSFLEDRILNAFGINSSVCEDDSSAYKPLFINYYNDSDRENMKYYNETLSFDHLDSPAFVHINCLTWKFGGNIYTTRTVINHHTQGV